MYDLFILLEDWIMFFIIFTLLFTACWWLFIHNQSIIKICMYISWNKILLQFVIKNLLVPTEICLVKLFI